MVTQAHLC